MTVVRFAGFLDVVPTWMKVEVVGGKNVEFENMHWATQTAIAFVICCALLAMMYLALAPAG
jgi:hypothetical protein